MKKKFNKKIVIYGGSFNPPHLGHARVIRELLNVFPSTFPFDELWIMLSGERRDKRIGISGKHRLAMLKIMLKELFPRPKIPLKLSFLELRRPELTTTYQTLKRLEARYPSYDFYFYVGPDLVGDIRTKWVNGKKLYDAAQFVSRSGPNSFLPKRLPRHITLLDGRGVKWVKISSTLIRNLIRRDASKVTNVTRGVAAYIKRNKLYL